MVSFKVEQILIPENYIRMLMNKTEFDELLISQFDESALVFECKGLRYIFFDGEYAIEECLK